MKHILIVNSEVTQIIPDFDPIFPDVPVTERYAPTFLADCVTVGDDQDVPLGYLYDSKTGTFSEPPIPEPVAPIGPATPEPSIAERVAALEDTMMAIMLN